jgi:hypothetical protein
MLMRHKLAVALACFAAAMSANAAGDPYAALAPLIGEWHVGPPGAGPAFVERFRWGPRQAYIWVSVALMTAADREHLHFEGMVVWNAATRRYDYLFAVEPGSFIQEQGEFRVAESGVIVRDVRLTDADGNTARFRQTFRASGANRYETTLMRETPDGWKPTFPGSDNLVMARRNDPPS